MNMIFKKIWDANIMFPFGCVCISILSEKSQDFYLICTDMAKLVWHITSESLKIEKNANKSASLRLKFTLVKPSGFFFFK